MIEQLVRNVDLIASELPHYYIKERIPIFRIPTLQKREGGRESKKHQHVLKALLCTVLDKRILLLLFVSVSSHHTLYPYCPKTLPTDY